MNGISEIAAYNTGTHSSVSQTASNTKMDMTDYLKLLVAQLTNQDATEPMDTSEMVAQLAQMATVEAMNTFQEMSNNSYATTLLGKEVTVVDTDAGGKYKGTVTGTVSGVTLYNGAAQILVGGKSYALSQVMIVGSTEDASGSTGQEGADKGSTDSTDGAAGAGQSSSGASEPGFADAEDDSQNPLQMAATSGADAADRVEPGVADEDEIVRTTEPGGVN